jgi:hypothetical protein
MTDKFDIKDYFNYSISGFLWILIIVKFLDLSLIYKFEDLKNILQGQNTGIYIIFSLFFVAYILGNILRFTEKIIIFIADFMFGDFYSNALYSDKKLYLNLNRKEKLDKLGLCYLLFKKTPLRIGESSSQNIESNLIQFKIDNKNKKSQHIWSETYLLMNYPNLKYERLKNLKNLYESISFPFFVILIWISIVLIQNTNIGWYCKSLILLLLVLILFMFIDRYRYLKSNYIKDIYRYFLFERRNN